MGEADSGCGGVSDRDGEHCCWPQSASGLNEWCRTRSDDDERRDIITNNNNTMTTIGTKKYNNSNQKFSKQKMKSQPEFYCFCSRATSGGKQQQQWKWRRHCHEKQTINLYQQHNNTDEKLIAGKGLEMRVATSTSSNCHFGWEWVYGSSHFWRNDGFLFNDTRVLDH